MTAADLIFGSSGIPRKTRFVRALLSWTMAAFLACPLSLPAADDGGVVSPFSIGLSARALGMGGAVGSLTDDLGASLDNPAALATAQRQEFATLHSALFLDTNYDALGYGRPTARGSFLLAGFRLATQGVPRTTTSIDPLDTFTVQQWQGVLSYGLVVRGGLAAGLAVKYLRQSFPPDSDSGFGLDLGLMFRPGGGTGKRSPLSFQNFTLGLAVSDLVEPEFRVRSALSRFARTIKPSLGWRFSGRGGISVGWGLEGEFAKASRHARAGAELGLKRMVFLRAGYDGDAPTFGAGFRYSGFGLDWALANRDLGKSHRFSLTYRFGAIKDPRSAQRAQTLKWIARNYGDMERYPEALQAWDKVLDEFPDDTEAPGAKDHLVGKRRRSLAALVREAEAALGKNDMLRAVPALNKALGMDPSDPAVQALAKKIDDKTMLSQGYLVGMEAYHRDDYKAALESFEVVYRRDPHYRDVARMWSDAKGRFAPLEGMSNDLSRLYGHGVSEFLKGRYGKAIEIWKRVLARDPKNFLVQRNIAEAQARMNDARNKAVPSATPGVQP